MQEYPLTTRKIVLGGRSWHITAVEDQDALIRRVQNEDDLANFPYGLMLWPSALGLAAALAENPDWVRGKRVLEIGCGVGLAGFAAWDAGAALVRQTDYHADALVLARRNRARNGITSGEVYAGDWRDFPADLVGDNDLVIGSDVLYERSLHDVLEGLLPRLIAPGGAVLLSDPLRPQALSFVERLEAKGEWKFDLDGRVVEFAGQRKDIALFTLRRA